MVSVSSTNGCWSSVVSRMFTPGMRPLRWHRSWALARSSSCLRLSRKCVVTLWSTCVTWCLNTRSWPVGSNLPVTGSASVVSSSSFSTLNVSSSSFGSTQSWVSSCLTFFSKNSAREKSSTSVRCSDSGMW